MGQTKVLTSLCPQRTTVPWFQFSTNEFPLLLLSPGAGFMALRHPGQQPLRPMQCGPFFAKSVPVWVQAAKIAKNAVGVSAKGQLISHYARDADFCWVGVPGVYLGPP
jgi:hypothetical protein